MEYLLLVTMLFFAMRIVFKKNGKGGLILPIIICVVCGVNLFVIDYKDGLVVMCVLILLSLYVRYMYHIDTERISNEYR